MTPSTPDNPAAKLVILKATRDEVETFMCALTIGDPKEIKIPCELGVRFAVDAYVAHDLLARLAALEGERDELKNRDALSVFKLNRISEIAARSIPVGESEQVEELILQFIEVCEVIESASLPPAEPGVKP